MAEQSHLTVEAVKERAIARSHEQAGSAQSSKMVYVNLEERHALGWSIVDKQWDSPVVLNRLNPSSMPLLLL